MLLTLFPGAAGVLLDRSSGDAGSHNGWAALSQRVGIMESFSYPTEKLAFQNVPEVFCAPWMAVPSAGSFIMDSGKNCRLIWIGRDL